MKKNYVHSVHEKHEETRLKYGSQKQITTDN